MSWIDKDGANVMDGLCTTQPELNPRWYLADDTIDCLTQWLHTYPRLMTERVMRGFESRWLSWLV